MVVILRRPVAQREEVSRKDGRIVENGNGPFKFGRADGGLFGDRQQDANALAAPERYAARGT